MALIEFSERCVIRGLFPYSKILKLVRITEYVKKIEFIFHSRCITAFNSMCLKFLSCYYLVRLDTLKMFSFSFRSGLQAEDQLIRMNKKVLRR